MTQFLRRNTTEAPPGAYRVPEITVRSGVPAGVYGGYPAGVSTGVPAGVSSGYPAGVSTDVPRGVSGGYPAGVSTGTPAGVTAGIPHNVRSGVPSNVTTRRSATAAVPDNVRAGTPARSVLPATGGVPAGVSAGIPSGVSTGTLARGGVPANVRIASTAESTAPPRASAEPNPRDYKTAAIPPSTAWRSIAPTEKISTSNGASTSAATGWKSLPTITASEPSGSAPLELLKLPNTLQGTVVSSTVTSKLGVITLKGLTAAGGALAPDTPAIHMLKGATAASDVISGQQSGGTPGAWEAAYENAFVESAEIAGSAFGVPGRVAAAVTAQVSYDIGQNFIAPIAAPYGGAGLHWIDTRLGISADAKHVRETEATNALMEIELAKARGN